MVLQGAQAIVTENEGDLSIGPEPHRFILAVGDVKSGFDFWGPFETEQAAIGLQRAVRMRLVDLRIEIFSRGAQSKKNRRNAARQCA
jgi:hypothetical protein